MSDILVLLKKIYDKLPVESFKKYIIKFFEIYLNFNRNQLKITKIDGITYQLDLNEFFDRNMYFLGYQDKFVYDSIKKLCKNGMVALDIGANRGTYTFKLAQLVGEKGQVLLLNPHRGHFLN